MNTTELKRAMLEVLDEPTECRIIIETNIPSLNNFPEKIYYMIDRGYCDPEEVYNHWKVTNSAGEGTIVKDNISLIAFFASIPEEAISRVYVDSF